MMDPAIYAPQCQEPALYCNLAAAFSNCLLKAATSPSRRVARRQPNPCPWPKAPPKPVPVPKQKTAQVAAIAEFKDNVAVLAVAPLRLGILAVQMASVFGPARTPEGQAQAQEDLPNLRFPGDLSRSCVLGDPIIEGGAC